MLFWTEPSTRQLFQNAKPGRDASSRARLYVPRNGYASVQLMLRELAPFAVNRITVKRVSGRPTPRNAKIRTFRQEYRVYNDNMYYPDELTEVTGKRFHLKVKSHAAQGFWVDFFMPADARPGVREYEAEVFTDDASFKFTIELDVGRAVLPPASESRFSHEYFFNYRPEYMKCKVYSEEWWSWLEEVARVFKEMRNNTVIVSLQSLLLADGSKKLADGSYDFRFGLFDRYVELFLKYGATETFTVSSMIESVFGRHMGTIGPDGKGESFDTPSPEAEKFITAIYSALWSHLKAKGWEKLFRTHLEDEPHTTEAWLWAYKLVKAAAPGLTIGEPIDMIESARVIAGTAEWMVPRINVHDDDPAVFRDYVAAGNELWLYSCCFPEEGYYLNKFIDLPFIRSRLMEWAAVNVGAKGFLHWGFNYWGKPGAGLYGPYPDARFKGDGCIVYPDMKTGGMKLCARFMNTRDGMQDAELFCALLESDDADVRAEAKAILQDAVGDGSNFYTFSDCPCKFEADRARLEQLAERILK